MTDSRKSTAAIVLCGGESRRMQSPKAWLRFGDETLLQRVVRKAREAADPVVVVAALGQSLPPLPSEIVVARDANPQRGPLEGFLSGLLALPESAELVYLTGTDTPFLSAGWINKLVAIADGHDCVIVNAEEFLHPLAALYRREPTLAAVRRRLNADRLRVLDLLPLLDTLIVDADQFRDVDPTLQSLRNVNTPEDYEQALRKASAEAEGLPPANSQADPARVE